MTQVRLVLLRLVKLMVRSRYVPRRYSIGEWLARKLAPADGCVVGRVGPYRTSFDLRVGIHREMFLGLYDRRLWERAISPHLQPGDVFYDIGANIGYYSLLAAARVGPHGEVHAFEPLPSNHAYLHATKARNSIGHLRINDVAVAAEEGTLALYVPEDPAAPTGDASIVARPGHHRRIEVPTLTLDRYVLEMGAREPSFIKIDAEGAEPFILDGMTTILRQADAPMLVLELNPALLAGQGLGSAAITDPLIRAGYTLFRVTWAGLEPISSPGPIDTFTDLFARKIRV